MSTFIFCIFMWFFVGFICSCISYRIFVGSLQVQDIFAVDDCGGHFPILGAMFFGMLWPLLIFPVMGIIWCLKTIIQKWGTIELWPPPFTFKQFLLFPFKVIKWILCLPLYPFLYKRRKRQREEERRKAEEERFSKLSEFEKLVENLLKDLTPEQLGFLHRRVKKAQSEMDDQRERKRSKHYW